MVLDSRQKVYGDAVRAIRQHQALSYNDEPILVGRVLRSAHKVEEEMIKMSERQGLDESSRDFLDTARSLAKGFYLSVENTEYAEKVDLEKASMTKDDISAEAYEAFTERRLEWVMQTQLLFQGAAAMLGVKPPDFNW